MKDELRTDGDPTAWRIWSTSQNQLWQLRQAAPPLEFPGEAGVYHLVCPGSRGRTSHIAAVHMWSSRCIQESEKETEAS